MPANWQPHLSCSHDLRARIIERLMSAFTADLQAVEAEFGIDTEGFEPELKSLSRLEPLAGINGRHVTITRRGRRFACLIAAKSTPAEVGRARHSRAVYL